MGTLSGAVALRLLDCRRLPEPQGWKDLRPGPRVSSGLADPARRCGHKPLTRPSLSARCKNCGFVDDASNQKRSCPTCPTGWWRKRSALT